jgi:hypothetical protein
MADVDRACFTIDQIHAHYLYMSFEMKLLYNRATSDISH